METAEYRKHPAISNSDLSLINKSVEHFEHKRANPDDDTTAAKSFGTMFHTYVLEPAKFKKQYLKLPDDIKPGSSNAYKNFKADAEAAGRAIYTQDQLDALVAMKKKVDSTKFLQGGVAEEALFGEITVAGKTIKVKCRPDYRTDFFVIDLKSTSSAEKEDFGNSIRKYRYFVQGAFYMDIVRQNFPLVEKFVFIAVESEPPHGVACYELDAAYMEAGKIQYMRDLEKYVKDTEFGHKGYEKGVSLLSPPAWFANQYFKDK